jgi:hypothetical protein
VPLTPSSIPDLSPINPGLPSTHLQTCPRTVLVTVPHPDLAPAFPALLLTSAPAGARSRKDKRQAGMESGERKKLSSASSDGDHREENSLYPASRVPFLGLTGLSPLNERSRRVAGVTGCAGRRRLPRALGEAWRGARGHAQVLPPLPRVPIRGLLRLLPGSGNWMCGCCACPGGTGRARRFLY